MAVTKSRHKSFKPKQNNKPQQMNESNHYFKGRQRREKLVSEIIGNGVIIDGFLIDKGHSDGLEVHSLTDTGIVLVHNYYTGKLCTKLIARPEQIEGYYKKSG